jgi:hypothetical protein
MRSEVIVAYMLLAVGFIAGPALVISVMAMLFTIADDQSVLPEPLQGATSTQDRPEQRAHLPLPTGHTERSGHGQISAA